MDPAHLIAFNLTLLAALASPGPAMLMALRTTLVEGRTAGILTGLGLGTVAAAWTGAALLGLDVIFTLFPWAYMSLKIIGAAYLIYLAVSIWREAKTPLDSAQAPRRRPFVSGLLVNFANPKSVLFASAVLVVIFPRDMNLAQKALIVGNHMLVEFAAYTAFACALSTRAARDGYLRLKPVLDRIAAGVLGALGLKLAFDRS
ncbi:LysE family translocator [Roseovarius sp.]|uniref:LysE family translocator n=1 Tax=Roseovarius sp. TaxID=1486281 RepID=UPI0026273779|nr:LysE family translocator [Roseovarius sp.]MDM8165544.1 LysE family translocator [Roseovarius sp.]